MTRRKNYEELRFTDDFMFCKVMQENPEICKELTSIILGRKVAKVVQTEKQKSIDLTYDGKGVRFDVYFEDEEHKMYDIEMQTTDSHYLAKRSRYYQGMMDLESMNAGLKYKELKESYVIFICTFFDPFDANMRIYSFENRCIEKLAIRLGDETYKVFVNTKGAGDEISPELQCFIDYLNGKSVDLELFARIENEVETAKRNEKWRLEYMTFEMKIDDARDEAREEGRRAGIEVGMEAGREAGREEGIHALILDNIEDGHSENRIIEKLQKRFGLSVDTAKKYYEKVFLEVK